jgi:hypothetical protein
MTGIVLLFWRRQFARQKLCVQQQSEFEPFRPPDNALGHDDIGRVISRPDAKPEMGPNLYGHAAGHAATVLMRIDNAALSEQFCFAIEDTP